VGAIKKDVSAIVYVQVQVNAAMGWWLKTERDTHRCSVYVEVQVNATVSQ